jgi:hypothetical protein
MIGWGIGLLIHTMVTFGEGWKERKAAELYERNRHEAA